MPSTMSSIPQSASLWGRVQYFVSQAGTRLSAARARRAAYRRTFDELCQLSDRELAQVGISRYNIRRVAAEQAAITVPYS